MKNEKEAIESQEFESEANLAETMILNDVELPIIEYKGQRMITFKMIDQLHGRIAGRAKKNFYANIAHFEVGNDFIELDQESELRTLGFTRPQGGTPAKVILLTEFGYLMLVRSQQDPLARKVMRTVIKGYFAARAVAAETDLAPRVTDSIAVLEAYIAKAKSEEAALRALAAEKEMTRELTGAVETMAPKAEVFDRVFDSSSTISIGEVAKSLGIGPKTYFKMLREQGVLMDNNAPYQEHINEGRFKRIPQTYSLKGEYQSRVSFKTVATGKGYMYLAQRHAQAKAEADLAKMLGAGDGPKKAINPSDEDSEHGDN